MMVRAETFERYWAKVAFSPLNVHSCARTSVEPANASKGTAAWMRAGPADGMALGLSQALPWR